MLSRHDISDDHWNRIQTLLPGQVGGHGGVGNDTLDAIRYPAKTGIAWADLPPGGPEPRLPRGAVPRILAGGGGR